MSETEEITEAMRHGRVEAQALDLRLRAVEGREREERLARLAGDRADLAAVATHAPHGDTVLVDRLQREVEQLAAYQRAVVRSRGWRFVQMLRRPFGRSW